MEALGASTIYPLASLMNILKIALLIIYRI